MQFYLIHRGTYLRIRKQVDELRDGKIGDTYRLYEPRLYQFFHRFPRLAVRDRVKCKDTVLINSPVRIGRRHTPVHEIEVEVVEPQILERRLARGTHRIACMRRVPKLACDEHVFPLHLPTLKYPPERLPYFFLIAIGGSAINMAVSGFGEGVLNRICRPNAAAIALVFSPALNNAVSFVSSSLLHGRYALGYFLRISSTEYFFAATSRTDRKS